MKKIIFTGLLVVIQASFCLNIWSQDVSKVMAVRAALHYTNLHKADNYQSMVRCATAPQSCAMGLGSDTLMVEKVSLTGEAFMWLVPTTDGWYLISPTQKTTPVFAYFPTTIKPSFEDFSPAAFDLMKMYEEYVADCLNSNEIITTEQSIQTKWAEINSPNATISSTASESSSSVAPLLQKKGVEVIWGQSGPSDDCERNYNKFCPAQSGSSCGRAVVGCVAVAIAQIMWYWEWPYAATIPTTVGGSTLEWHFYDWDKMPAKIDTSTPMEHINMIAGFLRDCGYAVDMDYGISSGAYNSSALNALKDNFGYSKDMKLSSKFWTSGWRKMLMAELYAGRPVYYSGVTEDDEGHAFVIEGYDAVTDNYYVNFGWKGYCNAYVDLDDMPAGGDNYKRKQHMITGIQPAPICSAPQFNQRTWGNPSRFRAVYGGDITLDGIIMSGVEKGIIYSGSQVALKNGTKISTGCNVHIAVKNTHCDSTPSATNISESAISDDKEETTANKPHRLEKHIPECNAVVDHIAVYNISGQLLQTIYGADTDFSFLPSGFYVLQKHLSDGRIVSETITNVTP